MSPRRRPPAAMDRVAEYRLVDPWGRTILRVEYPAPERGFEAACHAAYVLGVTSDAARVTFTNSRGRTRSFNMGSLVEFIEAEQHGRGKEAIDFLGRSGVLASIGWERELVRGTSRGVKAMLREQFKGGAK